MSEKIISGVENEGRDQSSSKESQDLFGIINF